MRSILTRVIRASVNSTSQKSMNCPVCSKVLKSIDVGDFEIDKCDNCKAIWFDTNEFENYYEVSLFIRKNFKPTNDVHNQKCPKCINSKLCSGHALDLKLNLCEKCNGVFVKESQIRKFKNGSNSTWDYYTQIDPFMVLETFLDIFE